MRIHIIYSGLIRLHILYHAAQAPIYGLWVIEELARHAYKLSPGTLYPILHDMERAGYLASERRQVEGRYRRLYGITPAGRQMLEEGKEKVRELFSELWEEQGG